MPNPLFPLMPQEAGDDAVDQLFGPGKVRKVCPPIVELEDGGTLQNGHLNKINGTGSETLFLNDDHTVHQECVKVKNYGTGKVTISKKGSDSILLMDGQSVSVYDVSAASAVEFVAPRGANNDARAWDVVE